MKNVLPLILSLFALQTVFAQVQIDTALDFSVKDIYGNKIELYELLDQDKLVVIDFFSTSCGPCGLYAPDFQGSFEDFGENAGNVYFLSMCWGDDNAGVAYFDSIHGLTHPSVSGSQGGGNQVHNDYQVISTPTVILISPDRVIVEQQIWEPTRENINAAVIAAGGALLGSDEQNITLEIPMTAYPNPASGHLAFSFRALEGAYFYITLTGLSGTLAHTSPRQYSRAGEVQFHVDAGHLMRGFYIATLMQNDRPAGSMRILLLD